MIECGPVDFQKPETHRCYSCPRCVVELYVPVWHLKELAEHPQDHHSKKKLALPSSESRGTLWDWELDGRLRANNGQF